MHPHQAQEAFPLHILNTDVYRQILTFLEPEDRARLHQANRTYYNMQRSNPDWRAQQQRVFCNWFDKGNFTGAKNALDIVVEDMHHVDEAWRRARQDAGEEEETTAAAPFTVSDDFRFHAYAWPVAYPAATTPALVTKYARLDEAELPMEAFHYLRERSHSMRCIVAAFALYVKHNLQVSAEARRTLCIHAAQLGALEVLKHAYKRNMIIAATDASLSTRHIIEAAAMHARLDVLTFLEAEGHVPPGMYAASTALEKATRYGHVEVLQHLLQKEEVASQKMRALDQGVASGKKDAVIALCNTMPFDETAYKRLLNTAVTNANLAIVIALGEWCATSPTLETLQGVFAAAVTHGKTDVLIDLRNMRISPPKEDEPSFINRALIGMHVGVATELHVNWDVRKPDNLRRKFLEIMPRAAQAGRLDVMDAVRVHIGSPLNDVEFQVCVSCLHSAVLQDMVHILKSLRVDWGMKLSVQRLTPIIDLATQHLAVDCVLELSTNWGVVIQSDTIRRWYATLFCQAAIAGNIHVMKRLRELDIFDVNRTELSEAVSLAVRGNKLTIVQHLRVDWGARMEGVNLDGANLLSLALDMVNEDLVCELYIEWGYRLADRSLPEILANIVPGVMRSVRNKQSVLNKLFKLGVRAEHLRPHLHDILRTVVMKRNVHMLQSLRLIWHVTWGHLEQPGDDILLSMAQVGDAKMMVELLHEWKVPLNNVLKRQLLKAAPEHLHTIISEVPG